MTLIPNDFQNDFNEAFEISIKEIDALKAENKELKEKLRLHSVSNSIATEYAEVKMTKDELITKQQLQIEKYKEMLKVNKKLKSQIVGKFYSIGQPLNDNVLQMNEDQMKWCFEVVHLVEHLNYS